MKVVILCGGLGTRLREETEFRPKPMVPIGQRPILWHIMKFYAHYGFKEFVLCLGYKGEVIKEYFYNYQWHRSDVTLKLGAKPEITFHNQHAEEDWTVTLVDTGQATMTGGRVRRALAHIPETDKEFLLTYGDGVCNLDLPRAIEFHRSQGTLATVTAVQPSGRFGELSLDGDKILNFNEKPDSGYVSGGFFVLNRGIEKYLGHDDDRIFEQTALPALALEGQLSAYRHEGFWQCMDNQREVELLNKLWSSGQAPWKIW